jgi:prophage regulatory protein
MFFPADCAIIAMQTISYPGADSRNIVTTMNAKTHRRRPSHRFDPSQVTFNFEGADVLDQVLSTREIVRITGRHRVTIYRWIQAGLFPRKHATRGHKVGWLRSDVQRWLKHERPFDDARLQTSDSRQDPPGDRV